MRPADARLLLACLTGAAFYVYRYAERKLLKKMMAPEAATVLATAPAPVADDDTSSALIASLQEHSGA